MLCRHSGDAMDRFSSNSSMEGHHRASSACHACTCSTWDLESAWSECPVCGLGHPPRPGSRPNAACSGQLPGRPHAAWCAGQDSRREGEERLEKIPRDLQRAGHRKSTPQPRAHHLQEVWGLPSAERERQRVQTLLGSGATIIGGVWLCWWPVPCEEAGNGGIPPEILLHRWREGLLSFPGSCWGRWEDDFVFPAELHLAGQESLGPGALQMASNHQIPLPCTCRWVAEVDQCSPFLYLPWWSICGQNRQDCLQC